jgi:hypothetical protein
VRFSSEPVGLDQYALDSLPALMMSGSTWSLYGYGPMQAHRHSLN